MSEIAQEHRSRRGGGRDARRQLRSNSTATVTPFIIRQLEPLDMLNDESAELIENNAEVILEEIGIDFRDDPEALTILRDVGCDIQGNACIFRVVWRANYAAPHQLAIHSTREIRPEPLKLVVKIPSLRQFMGRHLYAI